MKYLILLLSITCIAFTSCEKKYTCACHELGDQENETYHTVDAPNRTEAKKNCPNIIVNGRTTCYIK